MIQIRKHADGFKLSIFENGKGGRSDTAIVANLTEATAYIRHHFYPCKPMDLDCPLCAHATRKDVEPNGH